MRARFLVPAVTALLLVTAAVAIAAPASTSQPAACTAAQKAQRQAALAAYRKAIAPARKAFFSRHASRRLRRAFVLRQRARLKVLVRAASCVAAASVNPASTRLDKLQAYVTAVEGLNTLFDPATSDTADGAIATVDQDEQDCADDPTLPGCPVDATEYTDTATAVRDAVAPLTQLATRLAAITPPPMTVADYGDSAKACGVDLVTVAAAQTSLHDANAGWASTLTTWGNAYAAGKSPDFSTANYEPGFDTIDSDPHQALVDWGVMVGFYWDSLAANVASAPDLPSWVGDLRDEECPAG